MIPALVGLGILIGSVLVVANWKGILDWLTDFIPKLKSAWAKVKPNVPYAAVLVGDLIVEGVSRMAAIMHRMYYKEDGKWIEATTTRKVDASEVPAHIRCKFENQEADITKDMEDTLQLTV